MQESVYTNGLEEALVTRASIHKAKLPQTIVVLDESEYLYCLTKFTLVEEVL